MRNQISKGTLQYPSNLSQHVVTLPFRAGIVHWAFAPNGDIDYWYQHLVAVVKSEKRYFRIVHTDEWFDGGGEYVATVVSHMPYRMLHIFEQVALRGTDETDTVINPADVMAAQKFPDYGSGMGADTFDQKFSDCVSPLPPNQFRTPGDLAAHMSVRDKEVHKRVDTVSAYPSIYSNAKERVKVMGTLEQQAEEFKRLKELYNRFTELPTVIEGTYPERRHYYETAMKNFLEACRMNGRAIP